MQTCWWPLSDHWPVQLTSPHLSGFVFYGGLESLTELSALWYKNDASNNDNKNDNADNDDNVNNNHSANNSATDNNDANTTTDNNNANVYNDNANNTNADNINANVNAINSNAINANTNANTSLMMQIILKIIKMVTDDKLYYPGFNNRIHKFNCSLRNSSKHICICSRMFACCLTGNASLTLTSWSAALCCRVLSGNMFL